MTSSKDATEKPTPLRFKPVTKATEADFLAVFEGRGGPSYCWCMSWRATKEERKDSTTPARRDQLLGRIRKRVPVGLIGYSDGEPVAWVSVGPRDSFNDALGGVAVAEGETVWSLTCMYLRRTLRGHGHGDEMIAAAIVQAKKRGANVLEVYPVDPDSPSYRFMGFVPAYERLGFRKVGEVGSRRHVMRLTLS
jgi:GNAT superfamily N-acetyltransferase